MLRTSAKIIVILSGGVMSLLLTASAHAADQPWVVYDGGDGPGRGKNIVFISGDEEYRSEEGLPMLGRLLAKEHGFRCTVLFSVNPDTGEIDPKYVKNIPGLEALDGADLLIILARFRDLPDEQMKHVDDYLKAGKPVIGLRTATHAFSIKADKPYARYSWNFKGEPKEWDRGFGRLVLGETWVSHWGSHKNESTRGIIAPDAKDSPLVSGIKDGDIWCPTDVYEAHPGGDSKAIVLGQVLKRPGPMVKDDPYFGMKPTDQPDPNDRKNNPMQPVAWIKSYALPDGGRPGKAFCTTMGSSTDLTNEALRRLIVNAAYFLLDMKVPERAEVTIVGDYHPSAFGFDGFKKGMKPSDFK